MSDICTICKKAIHDEYNRSYLKDTKEGITLFVHQECDEKKWEERIRTEKD